MPLPQRIGPALFALECLPCVRSRGGEIMGAGPVQPNLPSVTSLSSKERSQMTITHLVPDVRLGPIKFLLFPHITLAPHSGALRVLRVMKLLAQGYIACQECR